MRKRSRVIQLMQLVAILILVLIIVYSGLRILESTVFYSTMEVEDKATSKTIMVDGVKYFPKQDITVVLVTGIDQKGPVQDSGSYNNPGTADMVALLIFDEKEESWSIVNINRDTITDVTVLGIDGREAGIQTEQLALAYSYGSGLQDSCENLTKAVSNLLGGINIDYYVAMNVDAIAMLNDAVGGVTVNVEDDFSAVDPSLSKGSVTLKGEQARSFVQSRSSVGDQLNLSRMKRQKQYMKGFSESFRRTMESGDTQFVLNTYQQVAPYLVSNLPVNTLTGMTERYMDYPLSGIYSLKGENAVENGYYAFYIEPSDLETLRLELFYAPK